MAAIGIQTLSQAIEMLREDLDRERGRADRAERQVEVERQLVEEGRKRIDELQTSLGDERQAAHDRVAIERRRIDGLHTELADARTALVVTGNEAAALRTQVALLTGPARRPWWRWWFR
jgi:chromosome segregation ATPase